MCGIKATCITTKLKRSMAYYSSSLINLSLYILVYLTSITTKSMYIQYIKYRYNVKRFINASSHSNILLLSPPALLVPRVARNLRSVQVELESEIAITNTLEHGAQTERPRNELATKEKVAELRRVAKNPCCDDGETEPFA